MRLIDADALMAENGLTKAVKYGNKNEKQQHNSYSSMMLYEIADMIEDAPTVENCVVLPCKVGDTVYYLAYLKATEFFKTHIDGMGNIIPSDIDLSNDELGILEDEFCIADYDQIGITLFLTREEAEVALKNRTE